MVLEPGGGLSFPLPPGSGSAGSGGSLLTPARLFQRATPVFPFHLAGWPPHHPVLGQVQSQVQQTMQAQHQAAAAAVRFLSHHHPHHPHPALGNHPLVPAITSHHPTAHHLHHSADHADEDDEKKGKWPLFFLLLLLLFLFFFFFFFLLHRAYGRCSQVVWNNERGSCLRDDVCLSDLIRRCFFLVRIF